MNVKLGKAAVGKLAMLGGFAMLPLAGGALLESIHAVEANPFVRSAVAADDHDHVDGDHGGSRGERGGRAGASGDERGSRGVGVGRSVETDVFRDRGHQGGRISSRSDDGDESDRPPWAGTPGRDGKPGGGSGGEDRQKGGDFGDLLVILRDDTGQPILDENGNVQPCLDAACNEYIQLVDGEVPAEYADRVIEPDFGRLNVVRAPSRVLDHSLSSVLLRLDQLVITSANLAELTDESGRLIDLFGKTVDSPLENLAIYKALLEASASDPVEGFYTITYSSSGHDGTLDFTLTVAQEVLPILAASAFAAGADKFGGMTVDDVMYITGFLGLTDQLSALVQDYSYDRTTMFDQEVWVLRQVVIDGETYYQPTRVNVLDEADFLTVPIIEDNGVGIDEFTQHVADALRVLLYVHDYAIEP